jgi:GNAT superfamily N-acetyltransferase
VRFRSALPDDAETIRQMVARIWEGHDYLLESIERRIADGGVFVAELDGRIVGVTRLRRLADDEWWLEALRIDPDQWGRGLGRELHEFTMHELRRRGRGVARWATADTNRSVSFAAGSGFRKILSMPFVHWPLNRLAPLGERPVIAPVDDDLGVTDLDEPGLLGYLLRGCLENYAGLFPREWVFPAATPERLRDYLADRSILVRRGPEGFRAAAPLYADDDEPSELYIAPLVGSTEAVDGAFIRALGRLTRRVYPGVDIWSHLPIQYLPAFLAEGCRRETGFNWIYAYELRLSP